MVIPAAWEGRSGGFRMSGSVKPIPDDATWPICFGAIQGLIRMSKKLFGCFSISREDCHSSAERDSKRRLPKRLPLLLIDLLDSSDHNLGAGLAGV